MRYLVFYLLIFSAAMLGSAAGVGLLLWQATHRFYGRKKRNGKRKR